MKWYVPILLIASILVSYHWGLYRGRSEEVPIAKTDTLYVVDTILTEKPIPYKVEVLDTIYLSLVDTIRVRETLVMPLPREQKIYKDERYMAVISGVMPSLDHIETYQINKTITNTIVKKRNHWGFSATIGPFLGYGVKGPDVGIGISGGLSYTF